MGLWNFSGPDEKLKSEHSLCAAGNRRISAVQQGLDVTDKCHLPEPQLQIKGDSQRNHACLPSRAKGRGRGQGSSRRGVYLPRRGASLLQPWAPVAC